MPDQTADVGPRTAEAAVAWILQTIPAEYQDDAGAAIEDIVRDAIGFGVDATDRGWNGETLTGPSAGEVRIGSLVDQWMEQQS